MIPVRESFSHELLLIFFFFISSARVADDNADMADYLKTLLSSYWRVYIVHDGEEALEMCRRHPPGLILSDVMMPRMDGFELVRRVRNDTELRLLPIILLSARAGEEARVEGLEVGADDYLAKPFGAKELVARVKTHLELGRLRNELDRLARLSPVGIFRVDTQVRLCSSIFILKEKGRWRRRI